jgi:excisionase family DNA binding protein
MDQINPPTPPVNEIMNSAEAAQYLRVSRKRLQNMVSQGMVPYSKLGRSNRFFRSQLDKLLTKQRRGPIYD